MSAQEAGPSGRAHGGDVVLVEDDTLSGEGIKVRGVDFGSAPADISPAQVIGNEKKDVRSFAGSNRQKGA